MLSAFLIALREGVEAALVVGIVLVYLNRTGRANLARWVWGGVVAAVASSLAVAIALERWKVSEDGFEGVLLLVAAVFVVTMIVWMNRVARHLKTEIEKRVEKHAAKSEFSAGIGLATFVFLMVVREGAELALILRAVELSTEGLAVWIGTILGLAVAVAVGVFFFQGTLKISLGKFFSATSTILIIVAVQLALTGVHELSEAMWLPSSRVEMAYVGPIVRNEFFFFTVILGAAALLVLREWMAARGRAAENVPDAAERRRLEWERRKQRRWAFASAFTCTAVILILAAEFAYTRVTATTEARSIQSDSGAVRIPLVRDQRCEPSHLQRGRERNELALPRHSKAQRKLGHRARRLPDLRHRRISPGWFERRVPQLRLRHLHPDDRRSGRMQSRRRPLAHWKWRAGDRRVEAGRSAGAGSLISELLRNSSWSPSMRFRETGDFMNRNRWRFGDTAGS